MKVIYGINPVLEALRSHKLQLERLYVDRASKNPRLKEIIGLAKMAGVPVNFEPRELIGHKAGTSDHQGVAASVSEIRYATYEDIMRAAGEKPIVLVLDGIEDPHNLGAIARTAEAAGVKGIFIPQRRAVGVTETVVKTSAGAVAHMPIAKVVNVSSLLARLKRDGLWIVGLDPEAHMLWTQVDYDQPIGIVVGGEGKGMHRLVKERCDFLVSIPMLGSIESLNVSVATGIILYEAVRQRINRSAQGAKDAQGWKAQRSTAPRQT